jgi:hypothetical protein
VLGYRQTAYNDYHYRRNTMTEQENHNVADAPAATLPEGITITIPRTHATDPRAREARALLVYDAVVATQDDKGVRRGVTVGALRDWMTANGMADIAGKAFVTAALAMLKRDNGVGGKRLAIAGRRRYHNGTAEVVIPADETPAVNGAPSDDQIDRAERRVQRAQVELTKALEAQTALKSRAANHDVDYDAVVARLAAEAAASTEEKSDDNSDGASGESDQTADGTSELETVAG